MVYLLINSDRKKLYSNFRAEENLYELPIGTKYILYRDTRLCNYDFNLF